MRIWSATKSWPFLPDIFWENSLWVLQKANFWFLDIRPTVSADPWMKKLGGSYSRWVLYWGGIYVDLCLCIEIYIYNVGKKKPPPRFSWITFQSENFHTGPWSEVSPRAARPSHHRVCWGSIYSLWTWLRTRSGLLLPKSKYLEKTVAKWVYKAGLRKPGGSGVGLWFQLFTLYDVESGANLTYTDMGVGWSHTDRFCHAATHFPRNLS